mmetsp:Transcript_32368/g.75141  ORF Transcript_32368/g.75141 Transcript_32368/m.75141 type:complete len:507 (+) Transcript_32368:46-1566(+)
MTSKLKPGTYAVENKAVGVLFEKGKNEYSFWVATVQAGTGRDNAMWESKLKPWGKDKDSGAPRYRIPDHPEKHYFVVTAADTFSERDTGNAEVAVWSFRDDMKGKFLTTLAAPPKSAEDFPTENFARAVLNKDPSRNEPMSPPTRVILEACCGLSEDLPTNPSDRQKLIAKYYTAETPLYHEMNQALRDDDLSAMRYYSAYIKELREVFKTDHRDQIITPFVGKVWRGITFPNADEALQQYKQGKIFVWSAFTSMSLDRSVAFNFGNVVFEVSCLPPKEAYEGAVAVYAPASVQDFSDFSGEAEILFPPNIQFKVKEVQMPAEGNDLTSPLVVCETVAFDSDEGIMEFQDFKKQLEAAIKDGTIDPTPGEQRPEVLHKGYLKLFQTIDTNKNKTLSKKETKAALRKIQGAVAFAGVAFPGLSKPGEGGGAIKQYVNEMFAAADIDSDGVLSFDELYSYIVKKQGTPQQMKENLAQMSPQDWTNTKKTLDTLSRCFENGDFSELGAM